MSALQQLLMAHEARVAATVAGSPMPGDGRAAVARGVRRGRRSQALARAGVAAGAVVALAGVTWGAFAFADRVPAPAVSPSASSDASPTAAPTAGPTPSPSATIGPDGLALPGYVTVSDDLPSAQPLPAGIWDEVGPGWVLATYTPTISRWEDDGSETIVRPDVSVLYLAAPTGERYQVLELDPDANLKILSWKVGDAEALMCRENRLDGCRDLVWVNLQTGALGETAYDCVNYLGINAAGEYIVTERECASEAVNEPNATTWRLGPTLTKLGELPVRYGTLSPSGSRAYASYEGVYDLSSGAILDVPGPSSLGGDPFECEYDGWLDDERLLFHCQTQNEDDNYGLVRVGTVTVASGEVEILQTFAGTDTLRVWQLAAVENDYVAMVGPAIAGGPGADHLAVLESDGPQILPSHGDALCWIETVVGSRVYAIWGCWDAAVSPTPSLTVDDLTTGGSFVLFPPFTAATLPEDSFESEGMTGCVIVGDPNPCMG